jgi:resolvase-like protein
MAGISGAKGRNGRPGLDSMLKDASRRKFDIVMAWAIYRLGRSLTDPARHDPAPRSLWGGLVPGPASHRHDDTDGQARFSANRRLR